MKISNTKFLWFLTLALGIALVSCEDDDTEETPPTQNDPEVITDLVLNFTDPDTQESLEFRFSDPDGPGGNAPTIDDIELLNQVGYQLSLSVLDASDPNDVEDITEEIEEEDEEHQFFYVTGGNADDVVTISYDPTDVDDDGNPIGLRTNWVTSGTSTGSETVTVVLRHEPNKSAPGASDGVLSDEVGGETDIEVTFNLTVQ